MGTQEDIQERINERLTIEANLLEGGFSQQIIGSVAYELANIEDVQIPDIIQNGFIATADREHLILKGIDNGLPIREAQKAKVMLEITGLPNAIVSNNVKAVYNNVTYTVLEFNKIGSSGKITVGAECDIAGTIGNVDANKINQFLTAYEGLLTVNNPLASYGGYDDEETEIYRNRLLEYVGSDASNANEAQYKAWAQSVAGVAKAVIQGAEVVGAGNVGVYISAINGVVTEELKQRVLDYIEKVQPINATVIVSGLTTKNINVTANLSLAEGVLPQEVKEEFIETLNAYLNTTTTVVSYIKVADLLFNCSGVLDVISYTLNGGTTSINIGATESAEVGNVVING